MVNLFLPGGENPICCSSLLIIQKKKERGLGEKKSVEVI